MTWWQLCNPVTGRLHALERGRLTGGDSEVDLQVVDDPKRSYHFPVGADYTVERPSYIHVAVAGRVVAMDMTPAMLEFGCQQVALTVLDRSST